MYKIVITETCPRLEQVGHEWKLTGHRESCGCEVYGYTPVSEQSRLVEVEIYTQSVESLDVMSVIGAVNGGHFHGDGDQG